MMSKEKLPVRIGAFNKPPIIGIIYEGGNGRNCKFSETLGNAANDLIKYGNFNCTVFQTPKDEGYGKINRATGWYDGMHGSVQRNDSDFGLAIEMVPLQIDEFKYGPVLTSSRITLTHLYKQSHGGGMEDLSVSDSFNAVSVEVWCIWFAFFIIFWSLFSLGQRVIKYQEKFPSCWTVVTFIWNDETFEPTGPFFCLMSVLLALLLLYTREYLNNFIKTELVQPRLARRIDSFKDVLILKYHPEHGFVERKSSQGRDKKSQELDLIFSKEMRTIDYFRYEPEGSVRKAIYDKAFKYHGSHEKVIRSMDMDNLAEMSNLVKPGVVLIEVFPITELLKVLMCMGIKHAKAHDTKSEMAQSTAWTAENAAIPYLLGYVYTESIRPDIRDRLDTHFYRLSESGMVHVLVKHLSRGFIEVKPDIEWCLDNKMDTVVPELEQLELKHLASTFELGARMYLVACAILILEVLTFKLLKKLFPKKRGRVHPRSSTVPTFSQVQILTR